MAYSIPYIVLVLSLGCAGVVFDNTKDEILKKRLYIGSLLVVFIFFGFRGYILSDWVSYYPYFFDCSWDNISNYEFGSSKYWEPGYTLLNLIVKGLWENWHFFVFVSSLINFGLLYNFLRKRTENMPIILMLVIVFEGLMIFTNLMRNAIAILVFLNALDYLVKRKPLEYYALCLVALSFHTSALAYFPLYFFFHLRPNKWIYLCIFIICNLIFLSRIPIFLTLVKMVGVSEIFADRIEIYTEYLTSSTPLSIGYLERLLTGTLIFCYYDKLKEVRNEGGIFINAMIAYFVLFFIFNEFEVLSKRFATLFVFGYWIVWYDLIKCFSIDNNRRLFKIFIVLYCSLRMAGTCHFPDYDYENILFGAQEYQERLYFHNRTFEEQI
ncbi:MULTISPECIES: EpsG family protein [Segatella]|uniref:EpsG family protein n=2 Tax=Segatella TaxID=2974251 RepID=A0AA37I065_SEGBR|nr:MULTISPECIES: EpsG family protein [Segatella]EFI72801.1 putative membrane protein [Segatella baroniae B14]UKK77279.1 EpsG family protein [Segatella baroniae B14]GJG26565.1 hypothetical protein PRRU23_02650 [Segatella bryantii]SEP60258.1 EpsG family protein [Segatella baroniae B14]